MPIDGGSLADLISFSRQFDPSETLHSRWGDEYQLKSKELWNRSQQSLLTGTILNATTDELLLCMVYCVAVAPYMSFSEDKVHSYLKAMFAQLRKEL
jgi:hypothetical protein